MSVITLSPPYSFSSLKNILSVQKKKIQYKITQSFLPFRVLGFLVILPRSSSYLLVILLLDVGYPRSLNTSLTPFLFIYSSASYLVPHWGFLVYHSSSSLYPTYPLLTSIVLDRNSAYKYSIGLPQDLNPKKIGVCERKKVCENSNKSLSRRSSR